MYIKQNYPQSKSVGYEQLADFLAFLETHLSPEIKTEVSETLTKVMQHALGGKRIEGTSDRDDSYEISIVGGGRLLQKLGFYAVEHWTTLNKVAERLLRK